MWKADKNTTAPAGDFLNWKIPAILGGAGLVGIGMVVFLFVLGLNYSGMYRDEAAHLYRSALPEMPPGSIPLTGGLEKLRRTPPEEFRLSVQATPATLMQGKKAYEYFCVHCHGPGGNGKGTVGQSFAPLPADLKSAYVQVQTDGVIFHRISLGFKRHPPLGDTVSEKDRSALVVYIRSVGGR
ncbi:MAG: cytochrome c [Thermodesulfobacteriota bacterium]